MKIVIPFAVAVVTMSTVSTAAHDYVNIKSTLTKIENADSYHMKPVHVVHARAQSDAPLWINSLSAFGSMYGGDTDATKFRGALDSVNTASVEGALMYVQAEGINYNTRSEADRCWRKNGMKYMVFYDIVFTQTNETLAEYGSEYGPMLPMDGGQCTPQSGTNVFSNECLSINGNATSGVAQIGPFIGGESKDTDPRAPYPDCQWYSFPNTCPLNKWTKDPKKTDACRASTRQGLCEFGKLPDGITCTYNYRILGFVPIDDVVGITSIRKNASANYADFADFCKDGKVEFNASTEGVWEASIPFWEKPQNESANAKRAQKLLDAYATLLSSGSTLVSADVVGHMTKLPDVAVLTADNPPCHENFEKDCSATAAPHGCKRDLYSQICTPCAAENAACTVAPSGYSFPALAKGTVPTSGSASDESTPTPTPTTASASTTSGAANLAMAVSAVLASFGLSVLMS
ncbi:hypothetical protein PHYPSEUDO_001965 [Phytophthora pseudosyringae]|uniref:Secreted protein n=1 Tax=Phytophthora pseudosyringae TaxID=221518 RepID=A0A8T1VYH1_9STRA|nr:hypothetical protein PHYPSEUDO_001965 [Phytophthora pseudosyringae]